MGYAKITLIAVLVWASAGGIALAGRSHAGMGYREALRAHRISYLAARAAAERRAERAREERFIARQTRYYSSIFGASVGRWFRLVYAYWPKAEIRRALLCIKRESSGRPNALGSSGEVGLFQLLGWKCNVWPPDTNIRLAAKRWREDGWRPWTTMREYW